MMSRIVSIGTAVPEYSAPQESILQFMQDAYNDPEASRKLKILFNYSGIATRHSVIPDFDNRKTGHLLFNGANGIPTVEKRIDVFKERAVNLGIEAINNAFEKLNTPIVQSEITHLITVTCTGIYAPGLDAELLEKLKLPVDTYHMAINFMGCNAAFHAMKIADMICKTDQKAKVLVVCIELCTLHFQAKYNHDNLLSNTIFGDGAAAVIMTPNSYANQKALNGLQIKGFYSILLPKGKDLMGWDVTPINFEMILDAKIPEFIGNEVENLILKAKNHFAIGSESFDFWAIHPGGKKILDTIKKQLLMKDSDLTLSYNILQKYGNMSSPTILFVLCEFMQRDFKHLPDETIFSIGFGPGLSIETALLAYAE